VVDLLNLFFRPNVLRDVVNLRMTCKYCHNERRFPVTCAAVSAAVLEVHLVECFLGGDISYYVPTCDMYAALNIYNAF